MGGRGWGLALNVFMATVRVCNVNLCLCVFSLPGQVCSYLITPTPESESCGAGLIVSVVVCVFTCVGICVLSLDP